MINQNQSNLLFRKVQAQKLRDNIKTIGSWTWIFPYTMRTGFNNLTSRGGQAQNTLITDFEDFQRISELNTPKRVEWDNAYQWEQITDDTDITNEDKNYIKFKINSVDGTANTELLGNKFKFYKLTDEVSTQFTNFLGNQILPKERIVHSYAGIILDDLAKIPEMQKKYLLNRHKYKSREQYINQFKDAEVSIDNIAYKLWLNPELNNYVLNYQVALKRIVDPSTNTFICYVLYMQSFGDQMDITGISYNNSILFGNLGEGYIAPKIVKDADSVRRVYVNRDVLYNNPVRRISVIFHRTTLNFSVVVSGRPCKNEIPNKILAPRDLIFSNTYNPSQPILQIVPQPKTVYTACTGNLEIFTFYNDWRDKFSQNLRPLEDAPNNRGVLECRNLKSISKATNTNNYSLNDPRFKISGLENAVEQNVFLNNYFSNSAVPNKMDGHKNLKNTSLANVLSFSSFFYRHLYTMPNVIKTQTPYFITNAFWLAPFRPITFGIPAGYSTSVIDLTGAWSEFLFIIPSDILQLGVEQVYGNKWDSIDDKGYPVPIEYFFSKDVSMLANQNASCGFTYELTDQIATKPYVKNGQGQWILSDTVEYINTRFAKQPNKLKRRDDGALVPADDNDKWYLINGGSFEVQPRDKNYCDGYIIDTICIQGIGDTTAEIVMYGADNITEIYRGNFILNSSATGNPNECTTIINMSNYDNTFSNGKPLFPIETDTAEGQYYEQDLNYCGAVENYQNLKNNDLVEVVQSYGNAGSTKQPSITVPITEFEVPTQNNFNLTLNNIKIVNKNWDTTATVDFICANFLYSDILASTQQEPLQEIFTFPTEFFVIPQYKRGDIPDYKVKDDIKIIVNIWLKEKTTTNYVLDYSIQMGYSCLVDFSPENPTNADFNCCLQKYELAPTSYNFYETLIYEPNTYWQDYNTTYNEFFTIDLTPILKQGTKKLIIAFFFGNFRKGGDFPWIQENLKLNLGEPYYQRFHDAQSLTLLDVIHNKFEATDKQIVLNPFARGYSENSKVEYWFYKVVAW